MGRLSAEDTHNRVRGRRYTKQINERMDSDRWGECRMARVPTLMEMSVNGNLAIWYPHSLSIFMYLQVCKRVSEHSKHITAEKFDALLSTNLIDSNKLFTWAVCGTNYIELSEECIWFVGNIFRIGNDLYHGIELLCSTCRSFSSLKRNNKNIHRTWHYLTDYRHVAIMKGQPQKAFPSLCMFKVLVWK